MSGYASFQSLPQLLVQASPGVDMSSANFRDTRRGAQTESSRNTRRRPQLQPTPSHQPSDPFVIQDRQHSASTTKKPKASSAIQLDSDSDDVREVPLEIRTPSYQERPNPSNEISIKPTSSGHDPRTPTRTSRAPPSGVFKSGTIHDSKGRKTKGGEYIFGSTIMIEDDDEDLPQSASETRRRRPNPPPGYDAPSFAAPNPHAAGHSYSSTSQNLPRKTTRPMYDVPDPSSKYMLTFKVGMAADQQHRVVEVMEASIGARSVATMMVSPLRL